VVVIGGIFIFGGRFSGEFSMPKSESNCVERDFIMYEESQKRLIGLWPKVTKSVNGGCNIQNSRSRMIKLFESLSLSEASGQVPTICNS
jgi:hypothetical protein